MNKDWFYKLKQNLEEAEEQRKKDSPPKKTFSEEGGEVSAAPSWKDLPEEDYTLFMAVVKGVWEAEQYKEKYIRTYDQVLKDCWNNWKSKQ